MRTGTVVGVLGLATLLAVLTATVGLGLVGWTVGVGCGAALTVLVVRGLRADGREVLLPGDVVTCSRALLVCGVAALTAHSAVESPTPTALLVLAAPALALDAVDGRVARRTGTATPFGARLDGEVDAFLILVLSIAVAPTLGWWTLLAGSARYVFAGAGLVLPWLRRPLDARYWRKVVAALTGVALAVAAGDVLPRPVATSGVAIALLLLGESFGRDVWWLWRRRPRSSPVVSARIRTVAPRVAVLAALGLAWLALLAPVRPDQVAPLAFLRLPVEALVVAAAVLVGPPRARRVAAVLAGVLLGTLGLAKALDVGALTVLDRPFEASSDVGVLGDGLSFLSGSVGPWVTVGVALAGMALVVTLLVGVPWALTRALRLTHGRRRRALQVVAGLAVVWIALALSGARTPSGAHIAAADAGPYAAGKVRATSTALEDRAQFGEALASDRFRPAGSADLAALAGADVLLVFVESYGRVAIDGPGAEQVRGVLDAYEGPLARAGFTARSAYLTSPTTGGRSWLAHSTVQSGLWVGDEARYERLLSSQRTTVSSAFARAGWRTVAVLPGTHGQWPEGRAFYGFDEVYGSTDLGYLGPSFGWSPMPDQYALAALDRLELAVSPRSPVMAQVDLTSSHAPWAPQPTTVDWTELGDGTVFHEIRGDAVTAGGLWQDRAALPDAYRTSVAYSLTSLLSFVARHDGDDLVVVLLGDHQPATVVGGSGGDRAVPVTLVASDPAVLDRVGGWGWDAGLVPSSDAPEWPMDEFRDRFLSAFSVADGSDAAR